MVGNNNEQINSMPVIRDRSAFDSKSGNVLERLVFNHRLALILVCAVLSVFFGFKVATGLQINASFEKMIPQSSPYIRNYLASKADLKGLGNSLRIVVENTQGNIYDPAYLEALRKINDTVFLMPWVDRPWVKSVWMPAVRWIFLIQTSSPTWRRRKCLGPPSAGWRWPLPNAAATVPDR